MNLDAEEMLERRIADREAAAQRLRELTGTPTAPRGPQAEERCGECGRKRPRVRLMPPAGSGLPGMKQTLRCRPCHTAWLAGLT